MILSLLAATAAGAVTEEIVAPEVFEAFSAGRTLSFERDGAYYGAEQYLENRRVIWRYGDGTCTTGHWFTDGNDICFVYDTNPLPQCWVFARRGDSYFARISGLPSGDPSEIRMSGSTTEPLPCNAPDLGV